MQKIMFVFIVFFGMCITSCRTTEIISDNGTTATDIRDGLSELGEQQTESGRIEQSAVDTGKELAEQSNGIEQSARETAGYLAEQAEYYNDFKSVCKQIREQLVGTEQ